MGYLSVSYVSLLEEDSWKPVSGFLWALSKVTFPLADFALYPFTVTNQSHSSVYMWSSGIPSSETESGGGLRDPCHSNLSNNYTG